MEKRTKLVATSRRTIARPSRRPHRAGATSALLTGLAFGVLGSLGAGLAAPGATVTHAWSHLTVAGPPARSGAVLAYDRADRETILFGGDRSNGTPRLLGDTWSFVGGVWTRLHISGPMAREDATMVYDASDGYLLLFGGSNTTSTRTTYLNDSWSFVGNRWTQLSPSAVPPGRYDAMMTYDAATGEVLLAGGANGGNLTDLWAFHGGNWSPVNVSVVGNPIHGRYASLAYDPVAHAAIFFGGRGFPGNTTASFANGSWATIHPVRSPPSRDSPSLAYDPALRGPVLFGGYDPNGSALRDAWVYHAGSSIWSVTGRGGTPPARGFAAMAYDARDGELVLFGGIGSYLAPTVYGDTWVFR